MISKEAKEYIAKVEDDSSLPAGERLKLLTSQGLWSERLWQQTKLESVRKIHAETTKSVAMRIQENQASAEDMIRVKLALTDPKTRVAMETINFLSSRFPNTPTIKAMEFLKWSPELLRDLLDHLKGKGIVVF